MVNLNLYKGYIEIADDTKKPTKEYTKGDLLTLEQAQMYKNYAGVLDENIILIDYDDYEESEIVMDIVEDLDLNCRVYETTRGLHFVFANNGMYDMAHTDMTNALGLNVDIKLGVKNGYQVLKKDGEERSIIWEEFEDEELDTVPKWMLPVKNPKDFREMEDGDGRNSTLYSYILTLQSEDYTKEEARETIELINDYVLADPLPKDELETVLRDESFNKPIFIVKNKFLFDKFAVFLKNNHHIKRINGELHIYKEGIYVSGHKNIEAEMIKHIPSLAKRQRTEVLNYLDILLTESVWSDDSEWVAFNNGLLNIFTDEFKDFSPEHMITNKIPWDYNPHAESTLVDNTLDKLAVHDKEIRMLMEEMVGYTFYRRNELRKAFILTGKKSNGKSTFLDMIRTMLGEKNVSSLDLAELGERFMTAELAGKLANIGDDIADDYIRDTSTFKKLVTGETIPVERKGQDPFNFANYSKFLFSANSIPRLGKGRDSAAVIDRLIVVPFNATFSKDDPDYVPFIKYELRKQENIEYLIKIGVQGLKRVLENQGFTESNRAYEELMEFEQENNPVLGFFMTTPVNEIISRPTNEVYMEYSEYCFNNGLNPMSNIQFSKEVNSYYELEIIDKKIDGKKYRVFSEKE